MWVRLDDGFATHPKILKAGVRALALQIRAICYASQQHTDGLIPLHAIPLLVYDLDEDSDGEVRARPDWPAEMVRVGLWEKQETGYMVHDFLHWNMSREAYLEMKVKLSKAGKKGMKSRWKQHNQGYNEPYKVGNNPVDNPPYNKPITQQSTSTATLNSPNLNSPNPEGEKSGEKRGNGRDYREEAVEVLEFLNQKSGKNFRINQTNLSFIIARLKSGVDVQTCKSLIARKVRDWTPRPDMVGYLRPETLFNQKKFEGYLAEVT